MRATFIPSFFPKSPACTLAVSCERLRTVVAAITRHAERRRRPCLPMPPDRGEIALLLFVHEATQDGEQQPQRSLRPQLHPHDEARALLRDRDPPFAPGIQAARATHGVPRDRALEAHELDTRGVALQELRLVPRFETDRTSADLLHALRFRVPLELARQVDAVIENILG
jgi:hypothetical protein